MRRDADFRDAEGDCRALGIGGKIQFLSDFRSGWCFGGFAFEFDNRLVHLGGELVAGFHRVFVVRHDEQHRLEQAGLDLNDAALDGRALALLRQQDRAESGTARQDDAGDGVRENISIQGLGEFPVGAEF